VKLLGSAGSRSGRSRSSSEQARHLLLATRWGASAGRAGRAPARVHLRRSGTPLRGR
jgi:hypothetical protein